MRRLPANLLDSLTLPGALVRGLEAQYGDVVSETLPEPIAALMRRLREVQDNEGQDNEGQDNEGQDNEGQDNEGQRNEAQHNEAQDSEAQNDARTRQQDAKR
jgi:hypothetical protein